MLISHTCFKKYIICFVLIVSSLPVISAETSECTNCHSTSITSVKHAFEIVDSCTLCHKQKQDHIMINVQKSLRLASPNRSPNKAPNNEGLSVPQFYHTSRLKYGPNKMVKVSAGNFIMGSNNRLPDEGPQHTIFLNNFYIDIYEVTNLQYKNFIDDTGRRSPKHFRNRTFPEGKADHPVTYVSWKDAKKYCEWAGKRLPTDEEWEKAARGPNGNIFPWGNEFDIDKANTPQRWAVIHSDGDTTPVGAFKAGKSYYGLYDMSGNVWEWTDSWYQAYPGNNKINENYGKKYKTLKGGSWWDCSFYQCGVSAPSYNRSFFLRSTKNSSFGFRCASDTPPGFNKPLLHAKANINHQK